MNMTTVVIAALCGLILGGGVATGVAIKVSNDRDKIVQEAAAMAGVKAAGEVVDDLTKPANNLTAPDLLKVACSAEHIEKNGDLLCREMFCRMQSRGIDAKTSGVECEQISNVNNKRAMMEICEKIPTDKQKACDDFFDMRI